jgi:hypothetical protein
VAIEAMVSGTPVITTKNGALPEIVTKEVGFICNDINEMRKAVFEVEKINPSDCRKRVLGNFRVKNYGPKY